MIYSVVAKPTGVSVTADFPPTDVSQHELAEAVEENVFAMFRTMKSYLAAKCLTIDSSYRKERIL